MALLLRHSGGVRFAASFAEHLAAQKGGAPLRGGTRNAAGFADQLRGPTGPPPSGRVVAADREFLLSTGSQQVLLHDHRNLKFLQRVSAGGIFGALMSSSGLAYAVSFNLSNAVCGGLALQTLAAAACLAMYLRTYVARLVLDPRRAELVLTGCGLFGDPLAASQHIPLALLEPRASCSGGYVKFRARGSSFDPLSWVYFRMPRRSEGAAAALGAQVGYKPQDTPVESAIAEPVVATGNRRFPGAGLGGAGGADDGMPRMPNPNRAARPAVSTFRAGASKVGSAEKAEEGLALPRKSLAGLRLRHGLPVDGEEEQKILEFFEEPTAYAVART